MEFNGTDFKVSIVGTPNKPIEKTRDLSIEISDEELDITTRDSGGWKRTIAGVRSWTASLSGVVDFVEGSGKAGIKTLISQVIARTEVELLFGTTETGDMSFTGKGLLMNVNFSTPHEGVCEWTADISGNGPITTATVA